MALFGSVPLLEARGEAYLPALATGNRSTVSVGRGRPDRFMRMEPQRAVQCALGGSSSNNGVRTSAIICSSSTRTSPSRSFRNLSSASSSSSSRNAFGICSSSSGGSGSDSSNRASPSASSSMRAGSRGVGVVCMAKGGGKEKKGAKKGSGIPKRGPAEAGAAPAPVVPYTQGEIIMHSLEVIDSYFRAVGKPIFAEPVEITEAAKALWEADFVVISHGTEEDPIFNYGNQKALDLFETTWQEFTSMPSRKSASDAVQPNRNELLASAKEGAKELKGIVRVTTKGREFEVDDGVLWTLVASDGENFGQAAVFRQWHFPGEEGEGGGEGKAAPVTDGSAASAEATAGAPSETDGAPAAPAQESAQAATGAP